MSNSTKLANPMKVITGKDTRWSYANVWEATLPPIFPNRRLVAVIHSDAFWRGQLRAVTYMHFSVFHSFPAGSERKGASPKPAH